MATVGDQLLNPESGWQRVDDANKSIKYNGNWLSVTGDPNTYAGTAHYFTLSGATTNSIEFYFYGTKLRIIDMYWSNRVNNVTVELDGVISSYNPNNSTNKYRVIVFERLNLQYGFHKVKLTTTSTNNNFSIDAIDIDSNGEIVSGLNKFLISSGGEYCSVAPEITGVSTAVPLMTSNTSSNGRAFAGSINSSGFDAWKAFDSADNSYYLSASGTGGIGHLGYEFDKPIRIGKYTLRSTSTLNETSIMPKNWTFEGSNDGVNWTVLDARADQTWVTVLTDKEYLIDINKTDSYKMYRINWTANGGNVNYTLINELKMFEFTPSRLVKLPNPLEQIFFNHGMNKGTSIDLANSKMFEQRFIVQYNSQLGSGKVFKQKIDTLKIPIKKASIT